MKIKILFFILAITVFGVFIACNKEETEPVSEANNSEHGNNSNIKEQKFLQIQDSILQNYASAIRLVNLIDDELSKISNVPHKNESSSYEQQIIQKIEYLAFQLKTRNEDIARLEKKIKQISGKNKELTDKIKTLESIIEEKNKIIASQNERINKLESDLGVVIQERDIAIATKTQVESQLAEQINEKNTAFYIIGNEKDLEKAGIIIMEGEGFLGIGGKWVPNPDADISLFTKINIINNTEISIPANLKIDEIVSSHNKNFISLAQNESGAPTLKISNPEGFWRADKRLIIITKEK